MIWLAFFNSCYGQTWIVMPWFKVKGLFNVFADASCTTILCCFVVRLPSKKARNPADVLASWLSLPGGSPNEKLPCSVGYVKEKRVDAVSLQKRGKIDKIEDITFSKSILPSNCDNNIEFQLKSLEELQLKLSFWYHLSYKSMLVTFVALMFPAVVNIIIYAVYEPVQGSLRYITLRTSYSS